MSVASTAIEAVALVLKLKKESANTRIRSEINFWAQSAEDDMHDQACRVWLQQYYDLTMMMIPGTAQLISEGVFIVGYKFIIARQYFDVQNQMLGELSRFVFLAFNDDGKIAELYHSEQITDFAPRDKPN